MRFLCLHGRGTNAKIFEMQTTRLREELEDHEFVFVDGIVPTGPGEGAADVDEEFYGYIGDELDVGQCRELVLGLRDFVLRQGPFDGVMGFSEGGIVAAMLLVEDARRPFASFKCGIFFSAALPLDPDVAYSGILRCVEPAADGVLLRIPTAHIVGANEPFDHLSRLSPLAPLWASAGIEDPRLLHQYLARICESRVREMFLHGLGHQVPGAKVTESLSGPLRVIERTIENARAQSA